MLLSSQSSEIPPPRYKMTQMNLPHNTSTSTVAQAVSLYQPVTSHSSRIIFRSMVFMAAAQRGRGGEGGTPMHYLHGYVPPNGVVILKLSERGIHFRGVF